MINFICKEIFGHMESSQPALTIPSQFGKPTDPLPKNANPGVPTRQRTQNGILGLDIFRNFAEKNNKHGSSKHLELKEA